MIINDCTYYIGNSQVEKIYLGAELVYEAVSPEPCEGMEVEIADCEMRGGTWDWVNCTCNEPVDPCQGLDGQDLCECEGRYWWDGECHDEPEPDYRSMPITMKVLSAGTISFKPYNSTAYTADTAVFIPMLNGQNIGEYHPAFGGNCWFFEPSQDTTAKVVNVVEGDVFEIRQVPSGSFQRIGKGNNQTGANTAYYTFSGSTAGIELYGNILSMCCDNYTAHTTWASAAANYDGMGNTADTRYAVCGLFRYMTGLVSAENLWLPDDVPAGGYLNLFNRCEALEIPPRIFPAEIVTPWCYGSTFAYCSALPESPIIAATGYTTTVPEGFSQNGHLNTMFQNCSSLNKITCFMDQTNMTTTQRNNVFANWVSGVASTGNFYKREGTGWYSGTYGIPTNWTMNIYTE